MPNPTKFNLERKPQAVVLVAANKESPKGPLDFDFEWFETDAGRVAYYDEVLAWSVADQAKHDDAFMLTAEVTDTKTMTLGRVECIGPDPVFAQDWQARVVADPTLLVKPSRKRATGGAAKPARVKPKVKGRAQTAAAAALAPEDAVADPTPKAAKVRKPKAEGAAVVDDKAALEKAIPAKGAAALKARLAAKKVAEPAPVEMAEAEKEANVLAAITNVLAGADPVAEADKVMAMGWAIPLGRRANGRFARI